VSEVMGRYAPNGVAIEQLALDINGADEGDAAQLESTVAVRAYLLIDAELEIKKRQIEEGLWHLSHIKPIAAPVFRTVSESDWANAWKEHYHVAHLGDRFVIKPSWREYDAQPHEIVIELDPGMAFGTGLHPTTRMCLAAIEKYLQRRTMLTNRVPAVGIDRGDAVDEQSLKKMSVLDLGTGSGILAIGAAKLGAGSILAVDIDPLSVKVATENAIANGVDRIIEVRSGSLAEAAKNDATYDLIAVNILAKIIIQLCEENLGRVVRSGGRAIFAGLIDTQELGVREALQSQSLIVIDRLQDKDWVCLIAQKN
ncbi:MAG TPA: 50S ribosomal protein L11 methyltransferase, partial [Anaerolineae bacterium]|nr:50S ribosomal protein L11 methyltransferase [Anaerolineae bacterium]